MKNTNVILKWGYLKLKNLLSNFTNDLDIDLNENKNNIMRLLKESNYKTLSTEQSVWLFKQVKEAFLLQIDTKKDQYLSELIFIENFKNEKPKKEEEESINYIDPVHNLDVKFEKL